MLWAPMAGRPGRGRGKSILEVGTARAQGWQEGGAPGGRGALGGCLELTVD